MTARAGPNALEYIDKANEIAGDVFFRTCKGALYPNLSGQINHGFEIAVAKRLSTRALSARSSGKNQKRGPMQSFLSRASLSLGS